MKTNKISIVLPTYNGEKHIAESIESVLAQSYSEWELIIVNDCSTDNTSEIIEYYAKLDERIKIIENEINLKLPKSLNKGFEQATGEYFTWTSDDNAYEKDALQSMLEILEMNEEIGLVYCDQALMDDEGNVIKADVRQEPRMFYMGNCVGACFMYRATVAKEVGEYNPKLFLVEDYDYWLRIFLKKKIAVCHEALYRYRLHENSLTSTRHEEIMHRTARLWMTYLEELLSLIPSYEEKRKFFDRIILSASEADRDKFEKIICSYSRLYSLRRKRKRIMKLCRNLLSKAGGSR